MNFRHTLLAAQVYIHICFIAGMVLLPLGLTTPIILISHLVFVGLCGTVYYHRVMAHKIAINPKLESALMWLSWVGCSGSVLAWVGTHRKHHRYQDTPKDPHSPHHSGFLKTYWWSSGVEDTIRYVPDLLRKSMYVWQHKFYFQVIAAAHIVGLVMLPWWAYWAFLVCPAFLMWFSGSMVNVFSHDRQGPRNSFLLGVLFAGEGWHKNHHDDAGNPNFGHRLDWGFSIFKWIHHGKDQAQTTSVR